jgi:hypothetical protein
MPDEDEISKKGIIDSEFGVGGDDLLSAFEDDTLTEEEDDDLPLEDEY